jgi:hypothetical protein
MIKISKYGHGTWGSRCRMSKRSRKVGEHRTLTLYHLPLTRFTPHQLSGEQAAVGQRDPCPSHHTPHLYNSACLRKTCTGQRDQLDSTRHGQISPLDPQPRPRLNSSCRRWSAARGRRATRPRSCWYIPRRRQLLLGSGKIMDSWMPPLPHVVGFTHRLLAGSRPPHFSLFVRGRVRMLYWCCPLFGYLWWSHATPL